MTKRRRGHGTRCPVCHLGYLTAEPGEIVVPMGDRAYEVTVPGHRCDGRGCWRPAREWGDGRRRGDRTWMAAWSRHTRAFLSEHPWCERCAAKGQRTQATESNHRVYRSQGGGDGFENLEPLCATCHGAEHNQKRGTA